MKAKKLDRPVCNVCGAPEGKGKYKELMINPGFTTTMICHSCYQQINWSILSGLRRLGVFGRIQEPRSKQRKYSDEKSVQDLLDKLVELIRLNGLDVKVNLPSRT